MTTRMSAGVAFFTLSAKTSSFWYEETKPLFVAGLDALGPSLFVHNCSLAASIEWPGPSPTGTAYGAPLLTRNGSLDGDSGAAGLRRLNSVPFRPLMPGR